MTFLRKVIFFTTMLVLFFPSIFAITLSTNGTKDQQSLDENTDLQDNYSDDGEEMYAYPITPSEIKNLKKEPEKLSLELFPKKAIKERPDLSGGVSFFEARRMLWPVGVLILIIIIVVLLLRGGNEGDRLDRALNIKTQKRSKWSNWK